MDRTVLISQIISITTGALCCEKAVGGVTQAYAVGRAVITVKILTGGNLP